MSEVLSPSGAKGREERRPTAWPARVAALTLIVASPLATWWVIGINPAYAKSNDPSINPDDWDYLIKPPKIDPTLERLTGITAATIAVAALVVLIGNAKKGRIDWRWRGPILAMALVGVILGIAARVMTAAVIGANIGGGLMILFGTPVVLALLIVSAIWSIQIVTTTTTADPARS